MKKLCLKIYGIDCVACISTINKILSHTVGVQSVEVNYSSSEAILSIDETIFDLNRTASSLKKYGFEIPVGKISIHVYDANDIEETINTLKPIFGIKEIKIVDLYIELDVYSSIFDQKILYSLLKEDSFEIIDYDDGEIELEKNNQIYALKRLLLSIFLTTPILWGLAPIIQFILATLLQVFPGRYFYRGFYRAIKSKQLNMDFLIALSTTIIYVYSTYLALTVHEDIQLYYLCEGVLLSLVLFGKYLEIIAKGEAKKSIQSLMHLIPSKAMKQVGNTYKEVAVETLKVKDIIRIENGQRIPTDGVLQSDICFVDESLITGESILIQKNKGDKLIGGSLNRKNTILIEATHIGNDTVLSRMIAMIKEAVNSRLPIQTLADKISNVFIIAILIISILVFFAWYFIYSNHDLTKALLTMCDVLVVACPCALGLAIPTSIMVATGRGSELGILFRDGEQLEKASKATVVVFDKTGTLTKGNIGKDEIKDDAVEVVRTLKEMNLKVVMLSGDKEEIAKDIASKVGIDTVLSNMTPDKKNGYIEKLKKNGEVVMMVGDGVNDGPALASSDISITFQNASDIAKDVSGIVITNNHLKSIVLVIKLSKNTMKNIYGNLLWALCYNVICIPLASIGIMNPSIASAAMSFSSIGVLMHSLALKKACGE